MLYLKLPGNAGLFLPAVFPAGISNVPFVMSTLLLKVAAVPVMMESVDATPVNPAPLPKKLVAVTVSYTHLTLPTKA